MKIKTKFLLALATAALGAFAVPAMASAYLWTYEGEPIYEQSQVIDLEGSISFNGLWFPAACDVDGQATLEHSGGGSITKFDLSDCRYYGGMAVCKGGDTSPSSLPWDIQGTYDEYSRPTMLIDNASFAVEFITPSPCYTTIQVAGADISAAASESPMTTLELSGSSGGKAITGELTITPAETVGVAEE